MEKNYHVSYKQHVCICITGELTTSLTFNQIDGLHAKRAFIAFWADCYSPAGSSQILQTDPPRHEKHCCRIVFVVLGFVFEKQHMQKTQFSKGIFWRSFVE